MKVLAWDALETAAQMTANVLETVPLAKSITLPPPQPPQLRQKFQYITAAGIDLMSRLLTYDPEMRISAVDALKHPYFRCVL